MSLALLAFPRLPMPRARPASPSKKPPNPPRRNTPLPLQKRAIPKNFKNIKVSHFANLTHWFARGSFFLLKEKLSKKKFFSKKNCHKVCTLNKHSISLHRFRPPLASNPQRAPRKTTDGREKSGKRPAPASNSPPSRQQRESRQETGISQRLTSVGATDEEREKSKRNNPKKTIKNNPP